MDLPPDAGQRAENGDVADARLARSSSARVRALRPAPRSSFAPGLSARWGTGPGATAAGGGPHGPAPPVHVSDRRIPVRAPVSEDRGAPPVSVHRRDAVGRRRIAWTRAALDLCSRAPVGAMTASTRSHHQGWIRPALPSVSHCGCHAGRVAPATGWRAGGARARVRRGCRAYSRTARKQRRVRANADERGSDPCVTRRQSRAHRVDHLWHRRACSDRETDRVVSG